MTPPVLNPSALAPLVLLAVGAMVVLVLEVSLARRSTFLGRPVTRAWLGALLAGVSVAFLAACFAVAAQGFAAGTSEVFNESHPMLRLDRFANFAVALLALASALVCLLSLTYLSELEIHHGEYYALVLLATLGMMILAAATDLVMIFLGFELLSLPIYVLAGFHRRRLQSNESALKYFVIGSFASAVLLYGMALLYGATGHTDLEGLRAALAGGGTGPLAVVGVGLMLVGFAFKVSAVPFHQWTPDVYEGAPTAVTGYMAVAVKTAAFVALLRFLTVSAPLDVGQEEVLYALAVLTMTVGNVMAIIQENVKRLLAYSSIAHAGYILIGLVAATPEGYSAVLFYLLVYVFMTLGAFAVVTALAKGGRDRDLVEHYHGLARTRPVLAALMTLFMVSLTGIPPTAGFAAKFLIFGAAVKAGYVGLAIIGVVNTLVSLYYYLKLPVVMYMREPGEEAPRQETSTGEGLVLAACGAAVVFFGIFPTAAPGVLDAVRVFEWAQQSVALLTP